MLHLSFGRLIRFDAHLFEFGLQPPFLNRKRRSHVDGGGAIVPLLVADGATSRMHHKFVLDACVLTEISIGQSRPCVTGKTFAF